MPFPDDLLSAINQPPEKALAFLNKKFPTLKANYDELNTTARARAFTIARITELDVLQTTLTGLEVAMKSGTGFKEFQKGLTEYLSKAGWYSNDNADGKEKLTPRRLELIYKTNTDQAVANGRWQQLWDTRESRPYLQYRTNQLGVSEKHRAEHEVLNGRVFRIDDPVLDAIYPPRGFGCNCGVASVSEAYIKRKGLSVEESGSNLVVGEDGVLSYRVKTADGRTLLIAPPQGFENNVGKSPLVALDEVFINKLRGITTGEAQRKIANEFINNPTRIAEYEQWVDSIAVDDYKKTNTRRTVGFLDPDVEEYLKNNGKEPASRTIITDDQRIWKFLYKDRSSKTIDDINVGEAKAIPAMVQSPDETWYNTENGKLLMIIFGAKKQIRLVVEFDARIKNSVVNFLVHSSKTLPGGIIDKKIYVKIK